MKMRVPASIAVTALATLALAGCQFVTPQQTARSYTPSDGVNGTAGDVLVRNVFLLDGAGHTASMIGALSNGGDSQASVTVQWTGKNGTETQDLQIPAGGLLSLSTDPTKLDTSVASDSASVILDGVDATPGALFNVTFRTSDGTADLQVPVLNGSLPAYATLVPTPTPTPTKTKKTPAPLDSLPATDGATPAPTPTPTDTLAG